MNQTDLSIVLHMKAEVARRPVQKKTIQENKFPFVYGDCSQNLSFAPLVTKKRRTKEEEDQTYNTQEGVSEEHKVFIRQIADRV